jgi:hypothetical protein
MPNTLEFPDGIRLAHLDELPGPEPDRATAWARIQSANIAPGFTLTQSPDSQFPFYAEANIDGPRIWVVFRDLCQRLLGQQATLIMGTIDDEPATLGSANTLELLELLEPHQYQLAHDGWLQFGLVTEDANWVTEVFVAPTKHFRVWLSDVECLRSVLRNHAVPEVESLEFIDEYPRTTTTLRSDKVSFRDQSDLIEHLERQLIAPSRPPTT